jgi:hypothetical protein
MYWIFSRFPDETVKMAAAWRRKVGKLMYETGLGDQSLRKADYVYLVSSGNRVQIKYPVNPVNPVYFKD